MHLFISTGIYYNMLCLMNRQLYTICLRSLYENKLLDFLRISTDSTKKYNWLLHTYAASWLKKMCHLIIVHFSFLSFYKKIVLHVSTFYLPYLETNLPIDKLFCWLQLTHILYWKVVYFKVCRQNITFERTS